MSLAAAAPKLAKLVLLLSSDRPGEVAAAASAITRILEAHKLSWHDLAAVIGEPMSPRPAPEHPPEPGSRDMLDHLACHTFDLTAWEQDFIQSILEQRRKGWSLSAKQRAKVKQIYERLQ